MRLAFRLSYLGTHFFGSQMQPDFRTVEGEFVAACRRLALFSDWRDAGFLLSGRTDRGVHSRGQVVAFTTGHPDRAVQALNIQLPRDCWCTAFAEVPAQFHPRYDARTRTYRYYFPECPADLGAMREAASLFRGRHDFTNFARVADKNPWRDIVAIAVEQEGDLAYLEVTAESFLWHQVRRMATVLAEAGRGERPPDSVRDLLSRTSSAPIAAAPAAGLILWDADCGIEWTPLPADPRSGQYVSDERNLHLLMAKVCSVLDPGAVQDREG
jgi:tRNA pseudouridine38-40 synthase